MDRNEAIKKAQQAKIKGGVGPKSCGMTRIGADSLSKTLRKLRKFINEGKGGK